jgi:Zn-dependent peptidase ImmA (M78 family)
MGWTFMRKKKYKNFKVDILGEKWQIRYSEIVINPADGNPACGLCEHNTKTIWISLELSEKDTVITLFHELFHAYVRRSGIYNGNLSHEMEEIIADQFGTIIAENFDYKL